MKLVNLILELFYDLKYIFSILKRLAYSSKMCNI